MRPIKIWGHWGAPNPWKVRMLIEELGLPHEYKLLELPQAKEESYLKLNPNGRLPTIEDPNTGVKLWESGAILLYLIDQYDKAGSLSHTTSPERYLTQQWLAFQISGQGPYFGQATWFARFHPEKIPSAIDRYVKEMERVISVLELGLTENGTGWLVGSKFTYADLSFITWAGVGEGLFKELKRDEGLVERYPKYHAWMAAMSGRPVVQKMLKEITENRKAHNLR